MNAPPEKRNPPGVAGSRKAQTTGGGLQSHCSAPRHPRNGTARAAILEALQRGESLTSLEAWQRFGASRLAADMFELRSMGWPIHAENIAVPARSGRMAHVARYRLVLEGRR